MNTEIIAKMLGPLAAVIGALGAMITGGISVASNSKEGKKVKPAPPWVRKLFVASIILFFVGLVCVIIGSSGPSQGGLGPIDAAGKYTEPVNTKPVESAEDPGLSMSEEATKKYDQLLIGSIYKFGAYEQDGKENNGLEPIEWIVLSQEGEKAFLVSVLGLDACPFADGRKTSTWADSSIEEWLNGKFYFTAFSDEERKRILETEVLQNSVSQYPHCDQGEDTMSYVFLLSTEEYEEYMYNGNIDSEYRKGTPSRYLEESGLDLMNDTYCWWWLRTSSQKNETAYAVSSYGVLDPISHKVNVDGGMVRPAIWITIAE